MCKLVFISLSQFFHNLRHFSNQLNERSTIQRFGNTTKLCNSFLFITSTVVPNRSFTISKLHAAILGCILLYSVLFLKLSFLHRNLYFLRYLYFLHFGHQLCRNSSFLACHLLYVLSPPAFFKTTSSTLSVSEFGLAVHILK